MGNGLYMHAGGGEGGSGWREYFGCDPVTLTEGSFYRLASGDIVGPMKVGSVFSMVEQYSGLWYTNTGVDIVDHKFNVVEEVSVEIKDEEIL